MWGSRSVDSIRKNAFGVVSFPREHTSPTVRGFVSAGKSGEKMEKRTKEETKKKDRKNEKSKKKKTPSGTPKVRCRHLRSVA